VRVRRVSDEDLVARAQGGERAAFELLVRRYRDRVYSLCMAKVGCREDALDATQEVFLRAYRSIGRFQGRSLFFTWLFRIALNCSFSERKRRARRRAVRLDSSGGGAAPDGGVEPRDLEDPRDGPAALASRSEETSIVRRAIRALPERHRQVLILRDLQGLSYDVIAETLRLPVGSVKSRIHRARLRLREDLAPVLGDDPSTPGHAEDVVVSGASKGALAQGGPGAAAPLAGAAAIGLSRDLSVVDGASRAKGGRRAL